MTVRAVTTGWVSFVLPLGYAPGPGRRTRCPTVEVMWRREPVTCSFALQGANGTLDLMMTLQYRGRATAVPIMAYRARDRDGRELDGVTVHSCYGSTEGHLALTPGENTDLLYLRGTDARLTADVVGEVVELREQPRPENPVTRAVGVDDAGNELPSGGGFTHVAVGNPGSVEAFSRVVAVALDSPADGPQGALEVVVLTPQPIAIPARTQVVVTPPPDAYAAIASYFGSSFVTVKAFPAAD
ncbi:hypothetical protein GCM10022204_38950 [Microlunatus aurantiacus]|uniref:Uncharacterized protein n=2 Tax=Microlunatus aurantiacus TaxID=446786 RepID=A0ABP7E869_9ACTN